MTCDYFIMKSAEYCCREPEFGSQIVISILNFDSATLFVNNRYNIYI